MAMATNVLAMEIGTGTLRRRDPRDCMLDSVGFDNERTWRRRLGGCGWGLRWIGDAVGSTLPQDDV